MIVTQHHIIAWTLLTKSTTIRKIIYLLNLWEGKLDFLWGGEGGREAVGGRGGKGKERLH